jgi:hypothetical protein
LAWKDCLLTQLAIRRGNRSKLHEHRYWYPLPWSERGLPRWRQAKSINRPKKSTTNSAHAGDSGCLDPSWKSRWAVRSGTRAIIGGVPLGLRHWVSGLKETAGRYTYTLYRGQITAILDTNFLARTANEPRENNARSLAPAEKRSKKSETLRMSTARQSVRRPPPLG